MQTNYGLCSVYLVCAFARILPPYSPPRISRYLEWDAKLYWITLVASNHTNNSFLLYPHHGIHWIPQKTCSLSVCSASIWSKSGIILNMAAANERQHYIVTSSLTGWAHTHKDTPNCDSITELCHIFTHPRIYFYQVIIWRWILLDRWVHWYVYGHVNQAVHWMLLTKRLFKLYQSCRIHF